MFQCRSCGGNLRFDIIEQKLKCDYCGSTFDPAEYDEQGGADETQEFGVTIFTCQQCGAELISTDNSATGFCSYCGASTVLASRLGTERRPEMITPFQKTKEDCMKCYSEVMKRAWYAPKQLRNPEFLERFRGIYMPYWLYKIHFNPSVTLPAVRKTTQGDYTITDEMEVTCSLGGSYGDIPYDASSSFDDQTAQTIAPFSSAKLRPFSPGYLAGFYADTSDVQPEVYRQDAIDKAGEYAMEAVKQRMKSGGIRPEIPGSKAGVEKALGTKSEYPKGAFLPVWFLTWRKKDRVAYAIVNGETGKVSADIPVDMGRFFLGTVLIAAVLFAISNLILSVTAQTALLISSILALVSSALFFYEMRGIMRKENHIEDKGFFSRGGSERSQQLAENEESKRRHAGEKKSGNASAGRSLPTAVIYFFIFLGYSVFQGLFGALLNGFAGIVARIAHAGPYVVLLAGGFCFVRSAMLLRDVEEKSMIVPAATGFLAVAAAAVVTFLKPVEDWIYYAACIGCLIGVAITCEELIRRHNLIATRPVPSFFSREGGNDRREKDGRTKIDRLAAFFLACALGGSLLLGAAQTVRAAGGEEPAYRNAQTGYEVYLVDEADLLTDEEEENLAKEMQAVTPYGGAVFVSGYFYDAANKAEERYHAYLGNGSGTLFMIDMGGRTIYIFSGGEVYKVVSRAYANTITDNIYRYASRGEYYACASEAFSQIVTLLDGGRISQPMKYITNALIALILSLLINYALMRWTARIAKPSSAAVLGAIAVAFAVSGTTRRVLKTTRRYTGSSSSGGGGGGGGGGFSGGGGGGGGFSGGGGGHSF